jgi:hypothetical protein
VLPAASLPLLASHLRQAGLLPKWVHWLLQQLPQRPELFDRAFLRLFHKVRCRGLCSCKTSSGSPRHGCRVNVYMIIALCA